MRSWATVQDHKTESEWFDDYVRLALSTPTPGLPPASQRLGRSDASWLETEPGVAFIYTAGGSPDDRVLAEHLLREQLRSAGYRQAEYDIENFGVRTADWTDIEEKARRLRDSGSVQLLRNGYNNIIAQVQGDHGSYQTEIMRQDPNSRVITQWSCDCPWDQYAFQRTRQWKKYEGRPCSHVLATFWKALATPLDEDVHPNAQGQQGTLFNAPPGQQPPAPPSFGTPMTPGPQPSQGEQMPLPGMQPGMAVGTPPQPSGVIPMGPGIIPEPPAVGPVANPASVPGLRQPSPTNPVQYPGGTFSKRLTDDWDFGSVATVTAAQPQGFVNGNMVSTKNDDWGTWVGRSDLHGSGQPAKIPAGSTGEVRGQDPTTGMVEVLFMNKATGVEQHGRMEPWGATAFFFPSELVERPDVQRPGPAVKRR